MNSLNNETKTTEFMQKKHIVKGWIPSISIKLTKMNKSATNSIESLNATELNVQKKTVEFKILNLISKLL